jgi:cGMP-dependent protein kinase
MRKQLLRRIELQDDSINLNDLALIKQLGSGMFGNVFLAAHKSHKRLYALKTVDRKKIIAYELQEAIVLERRILMQLDHTFIMKLIKTFKDKHRLYFLMEFIHGTDLFEVIRKLNLLTDNDSRFYIGCIIDILEHLHEREIIYRDLKPENIVVDDEGYPKLIDFGTAKYVKGRTFTIIGTPHYMAPEVINGHGYGLNSDFWSVGIMLYEFLFGIVPFGEDENEPYTIYQKIQEHKLDFPAWMDKDSKAKDIIPQLLSKNPAKRTGGCIENLKGHNWFAGLDWEKLLTRQLKAPYVPQVKTIAENIDSLIKNCRDLDEMIAKVEEQDEAPVPRKKLAKVQDGWDDEF